ncbi:MULTISPECIES: hypothetical protein [Ruminococcus]|uniref:hypothetical protein n=1 Tax=Ruminococcus TaxID=1263 RepID=UPI0034549FA9
MLLSAVRRTASSDSRRTLSSVSSSLQVQVWSATETSRSLRTRATASTTQQLLWQIRYNAEKLLRVRKIPV